MGKFIDLTGQRFGRILVISRAENYKYHSQTHGRVLQYAQFNCICDCGNTTTSLSCHLRGGKALSCGCWRVERATEANTTHGRTKLRQWDCWRNIIKRCSPGGHPDYAGRGISYDPEWGTFEGFWEDMSEGYADNLEIERVDVNGNYTKENCCWEDRSTQCFNRRKLKANTSGRTGVCFFKPLQKWRARIKVRGVEYSLGYFDNFEDAVEARRLGELKYRGRTLDAYQ